MLHTLPLVLFTFFVQFAAGIALFSISPGNSRPRRYLLTAGLASLGLAASFLYSPSGTDFQNLENPPVYTPVWMSLSGLLSCLCAALSFLCWQKKGPQGLSLLTATVGLAAVVSQGLTGMFSLSVTGLLPLVLFLASSLALGAAFAQLGQTGRAPTLVLRGSLAVLLLIFALVPSLGGSGDALMRQFSVAWMEFLPHWVAVMLTGVCLGVTFMGRGSAPIQMVLTLVAVFCSHLTFFNDGVHLILFLS